MEAATLELYQKNIFRITGLPVDASPKEVSRQVQKLQMLEEMGGGGIAQAAFAAVAPPSVEQVRSALARMKEPEHRLVDEFFWYWPEKFGESKSDPAIQAVLAGDGQKAIDIWVDRENEGSQTARHNLAVMFHMFALDWTNHQITTDEVDDRDEKVKGHWKEAFQRWEDLAGTDELWEVMKERVRSLADEALTTGFVRRMRQVLPQAFDRINAEAALRFAEKERMDWAQYHVDFMRETHQGQDDVDSTAELVLTPTRKRVEQLVQSTREKASKDPKKGTQAVVELMEHCKPLMALFDLFHGVDSHQRSDLFDEVAGTVATVVISYQTETGDNHTFVELLEKALAFATGTQVRERLIKNISIGKNNLAWKHLAPLFKTLEEMTGSSASSAQKLEQVRARILPQFPALVAQIGGKSEAYQQMMDSAAMAIRSISIEAHNKHQNHTAAEEAIQLALKLAIDSDLRTRLQGDAKALAESKKDATCHFCGREPASKDATFQLALYGDVVRSYGGVQYRKGSVPIPRCHTCKGKYGNADTAGCLLWLACAIVGAMAFKISRPTTDDWIAGAIIGTLAGCVVWWLARFILKNFNGMKSPDTFPGVEEMVRKGWSVGDGPGRYG
ncbi:hypothetical protein [Roseimicrobium sp. ORNL1]|uniref:hypothetical protein n=1 Tax=Roseimicrobium sp. ORNL1 TaxID=2711231 RepID=UPI0013E0F9B0|nr:hypothetical protein [Roseimicrobium sp. ORNL1]QIF00983.1 hypothetical protein G5S37_05445 [Roseimicrobium sp. ORNL1]